MAALELAPVSAVVAWTGLSTADATIIAGAVEQRIGRYCHRMTQDGENIWNRVERTEMLSGELSDGVLLTWTPITAVTSVTLVYGSGSTQSVTLTNLTCDGIEIADLPTRFGMQGVLKWRGSGVGVWDSDWVSARRARVSYPNFQSGYKQVKVVYSGGYPSGDLPADLTLAAMNFAKTLADLKSINTTLKSENLGNYSYENASAADIAEVETAFGSVKDLLSDLRSASNFL